MRRALVAVLALAATLLAAAPPRRRAPVKPKSAAGAGTRPAPKPAPKAARKAHAKKPPTEGAPIAGAAALAPWFATLAGTLAAPGEGATVRVAWFGDSHSAAGFWPGRLRAALQARLGDGGPGVVLPARPWRGYPREDLRMVFDRRWPAESLRTAEGSGRVGLPGAALSLPAEARLELTGTFGSFRLHLLGPEALAPAVAAGEAPGALPLRERSRTVLGEDAVLRVLEPEVPGPFPSLAVALPEGLRLLGVDLRAGRPGAVVDELALNGAELFDLERWDPALRAALLAELKPSLLVLAYGTNDLGRRDLDGGAYRARAARLLKALRTESGAPVLLIGPLDRLGRRRRGQDLRLGARTVVAAMRGACEDAGCAFWDARAAMGGEGAIQRWRKVQRAQRDLVHLNVAGYQHLGDLLLRALADAEREAAAEGPK